MFLTVRCCPIVHSLSFSHVTCMNKNFKEAINQCSFMVDDIPVREVLHNKVISSVYPSKPMSVYATIWDGSQWATQGGKYPVDYKYSPFAASLGEMIMDGCIKSKKMKPALQCSKAGLSSLDPIEGEEFVKLSKQQIMGMQWARKRFMSYSYCKDAARYKVLPPECNV